MFYIMLHIFNIVTSMDFSFKEKIVIASLGGTLLMPGWHIYYVFSNLTLAANDALSVSDLVGTIVFIVILKTIIQSFTAVRNERGLEVKKIN